MKVLIAEDEKTLGKLLKMMLACGLPDCMVDVVVNGAEAVDAFRKGQYDVLLLDLQMPVKNGYQAFLEIQEICRKESLKLPFVVFSTGYPLSAEIEELAHNDSRCSILRKPVASDVLLETIKSGCACS